MPYMLVRSGDAWFVHKKREDGKPGKRMHRRPMNRTRATEYMRALYASEDKEMDNMENHSVEYPVVTHNEQEVPASQDRGADTLVSAFRELDDNLWIAFYTNNFIDLTGEIFSERAIDEYIEAVDSGEYPHPDLLFWHIPVRIGKAQWVGRVGHTVAAVGTYDGVDPDITTKFRAFFKTTPQPLFTSHGFFYNPRDKVDGVFERFRTFEISVIPYEGVPANPMTMFKNIEADMTHVDETKKAKLVEILGEELADKFIDIAQRYSDEIKTLGLNFREFSPLAVEVGNEGDAQPEAPTVTPTPEEAIPDLEVPDIEKQDTVQIDANNPEAPESQATQEQKSEEPASDSRPVERRDDSELVSLIRELTQRVNALQTAYTGLSDYVRLQFNDPRPATKAAETVIPDNDPNLLDMIERFKGGISKDDPLRDALPMFFNGD